MTNLSNYPPGVTGNEPQINPVDCKGYELCHDADDVWQEPCSKQAVHDGLCEAHWDSHCQNMADEEEAYRSAAEYEANPGAFQGHVGETDLF